MKIAVIVITYNRVASLERLLRAISSAQYGDAEVDLLVSIDYHSASMQKSLAKVAEQVEWRYGSLKTICQETRQGLRRHVLLCGDLGAEYDAFIMLEDDIVVSDSYFFFAKEALEFYGGDSLIGGISLYSPRLNEMAELEFVPQPSKFDVYLLQSSQSWGQAWSKDMWLDFSQWYERYSKQLCGDTDMPAKIYSWPDSSWKKFHMKYLVERGKYFIYPYASFSTNAGEVGTHNRRISSFYQVPLAFDIPDGCFRFGVSSELVKYDIFFEREGLFFKGQKVIFDLYATKTKYPSTGYLVSARGNLPFNKRETRALHFKPHELNLYLSSVGPNLSVYELADSKPVNGSLINRKLSQPFDSDRFKFYTSLSWKYAAMYVLKDAVYTLKNYLLRWKAK